MTYKLTPEQISSITDLEWAFSTERLLPSWDDIPEDFKEGNLYTKLAEAIFHGGPMPECRIDLNDGIEPEKLNRCIRAHLGCRFPRHEHKIAGVGYMIACACTIHPTE
jgi:hypothetical protein